MKTLKAGTWMLVADGGRAKVFRLGAKPGQIEELQRLESSTMHMPSRDLVSDGSGRDFDVRGPGAHTKIPRSDPHDLEEREFAQRIMQRIERAAQQDRFKELVIVADPRTLGSLRKSMPRSVATRVIKELNRDLTALSGTEIDRRVRAEF
jgi:protein required for attachment to host cells